MLYKRNKKQGNRGDMRKIHVTRLAALRVTFSKKQKQLFLDIVWGSVCVPNFRSLSFSVWPGAPIQIDRPTYLQAKIEISLTGCSPHVDFDKMKRFNIATRVFELNGRVLRSPTSSVDQLLFLKNL